MKKFNRLTLLKEVSTYCDVTCKVNKDSTVYIPTIGTYPSVTHALVGLIRYEFYIGEYELGKDKMEFINHIWKTEFEGCSDYY